MLKEYVFDNGLKLIYKKANGELTSVCISLDAGAGCEEENFGVAHAVEHMVYKNTKNRNEKQINEELSSIFGFQNAMTNYPYVIYYGTLLGEDFEKGIDLFSDIVMNPVFTEKDFKDEIEVIKQELNEWDEDLEQYCEDKLFLNTFKERRIKYPIIGTKESLENMTVKDIKKFYDEKYFPGNTSVAVISSLDFEEVKAVIEKYLGKWNIAEGKKNKPANYEFIICDKFENSRGEGKNCKVEIICPINQLNEDEMKAFRIFDHYFCVGVNSILFDELRIKNSLVYDVISRVSHENYIKLYKITFNTSREDVDKALAIVDRCIDDISANKVNEDNIKSIIKSFKLKRLFREEQSIVLAKELATYDSMFGDGKLYTDEIKELEKIKVKDIFDIGMKVLKKKSVEIAEG